MSNILHRAKAGRLAQRRYEELSRAWRARVFGRRFSLYFWTIFVLLVILVISLHPGAEGSLIAGLGFGTAMASWLLMPEALMPAAISRWQVGAWGEENTEGELKVMQRAGWTVAHDVRWGKAANHDHVVARGAVFVVNTKNVKDSVVTVENDALRVRHIDTGDSYLADRWLPGAEREASSLKRELGQTLGFPVHVYSGRRHLGQFRPRAVVRR